MKPFIKYKFPPPPRERKLKVPKPAVLAQRARALQSAREQGKGADSSPSPTACPADPLPSRPSDALPTTPFHLKTAGDIPAIILSWTHGGHTFPIVGVVRRSELTWAPGAWTSTGKWWLERYNNGSPEDLPPDILTARIRKAIGKFAR